MKKILVLGFNGSIGTQTIDIIRDNPDKFKLIGVSVHNELLNEDLIKEFDIKFIVNLGNKKFNSNIKIYDDLDSCLDLEEIDLVINGIDGSNGLLPSLSVINHDIDLALANKETIILGHKFIKKALSTYKGKLIPMDSEHNAIYQCLKGEDISKIDTLYITGSGGKYANYVGNLDDISVNEALNHPNWKMGKYITINSATLFNKGYELIEARFLFDVEPSNIKLIICKNSIIHGAIKFKDGFIKIIASKPDMKKCIAYSMDDARIDLSDDFKLEELSIDFKLFNNKAINLAYEVLKYDDSRIIEYCISNEISVSCFIENKIKFTDIYKINKYVIDNFEFKDYNTLDELISLIKDIKDYTINIISERRF